ncbi:hypothetical protein Tco_0081513, partial [Tanacetum coccineum]
GNLPWPLMGFGGPVETSNLGSGNTNSDDRNQGSDGGRDGEAREEDLD